MLAQGTVVLPNESSRQNAAAVLLMNSVEAAIFAKLAELRRD
jgi:hypothetical protein